MNTTEQVTKTDPPPAVEAQRLAGFWVRCGAFAIDFLLAAFMAFIISELVSFAELWSFDGTFSIILFSAYVPISIFSPGKSIAGITVVRLDGTQLTCFRRLIRCLAGPALITLLVVLLLMLHLHFPYATGFDYAYAEPPGWFVLGSLVLGIIFALAALPGKRALHDYLIGTRVVYIKEISWWRKTLVICAGLPLVALAVMYISMGFL